MNRDITINPDAILLEIGIMELPLNCVVVISEGKAKVRELPECGGKRGRVLKLKPGHRYWTENENVKVVFDDDQNRKYRYLLECNWDNELDNVTFIMLNPSVADFEICDPTLNRCVQFSKSWGFKVVADYEGAFRQR